MRELNERLANDEVFRAAFEAANEEYVVAS